MSAAVVVDVSDLVGDEARKRVARALWCGQDLPVVLRIGSDALTASYAVAGLDEAGHRGHVRVEGPDARLADQVASSIDPSRPQLTTVLEDVWTAF